MPSIHPYRYKWVALSNATRVHAETAIGASPRASLALLHAAQAHAVLEHRTYVVPDDLARLAVPVLAHRLVLRDPGRLADQRALVQAVLDAVPAPRP